MGQSSGVEPTEHAPDGGAGHERIVSVSTGLAGVAPFIAGRRGVGQCGGTGMAQVCCE
jgi:hypothetical protein